jgi:hypothetical protein
MRLRAASGTLVLVCTMVTACARTAAPPGSTPAVVAHGAPALAADALGGSSTPVEVLTSSDLAQEAAATGSLDAGAVEAELARTGFVAASSRAFAVPGLRVRTVRARVLRFADDAGALAYVAWLREHASAMLGGGRIVPADGTLRSGFVVLHEPGGCCAKDQTAATGVWRRGALVLSVHAIGAVDVADAVRFAAALDRAVT